MDRPSPRVFPLVLALGCNTPPDKHVTNNYITECDTDSPAEDTHEDSTENDTNDTGPIPDTGRIEDTGEIHEELLEVDQNDTPWDNTVGANIASVLMDQVSSFEVSGLVFHKERSSLFVTDDNGGLAEIQHPYGQFLNHWSLTGDLEGVTIAYDSKLYMANETNRGDSPANGIMQFDLETEEMNTACILNDLPTNDGNSGFEALTYIPFQYAPENWGSDENGYFIAGTQHVNELSVYAATSCVDGNEITRSSTIEVSHTDVAGLAFNTDTQRLYVLYDNDNSFDVFKTTGELMASYDLASDGPSPWDQQEGIDVFNVNCGESYDNYGEATAELGISEDLGALYMWNLPVSCQPEDLPID